MGHCVLIISSYSSRIRRRNDFFQLFSKYLDHKKDSPLIKFSQLVQFLPKSFIQKKIPAINVAQKSQPAVKKLPGQNN